MAPSLNKKDKFAGKEQLRLALLVPYVIVCLVVVVVLAALMPTALTMHRDFQRLNNEEVPAQNAAHQILRGLGLSVAAVRGWVTLGDERFKNEWSRTWKQDIRPAFEILREKAPAEAVGLNQGNVRNVGDVLDRLEIAHWWVIDAAQARGNDRARFLQTSRLNPITRKLFDSSTIMINEEKWIKLNEAQQKRLKLMADYRSYLAHSFRDISELILSPNEEREKSWKAALEVAENRLNSLESFRLQLSIKQRSALDYLLQMTPIYISLGEEAIVLGKSPDRNAALSLMRSQSAQLVSHAQALLTRIIDARTVRMERESQAVKNHIHWALIIAVAGCALIIALAWIIAVHLTKQIIMPVELVADGVEAVRSGKLEKTLVPIGGAVFQDLVQVFNSMWTTLNETRAALGHKNRDLETTNSALAQSNRELDDFAYVASHDLKEPLRGIHNYAKFLLEDYEDKLDEDGKLKLEALPRLAKRLEELISSLLHFSRVGRVDLALEPTDLNKVLVEVLDSLHVTLEAEDIAIRMGDALPTIICDRVRVAEVFRNLVTNAMKYNDKPEKWIEIGATRQSSGGQSPSNSDGIDTSDGVVFHVRDNGIGIREKHIDSVFRIFKRLHGRSKYGGGTGAGLTIVKKIIDRHDGEIWVESNFGEGTTFYFTLGKGAMAS